MMDIWTQIYNILVIEKGYDPDDADVLATDIEELYFDGGITLFEAIAEYS